MLSWNTVWVGGSSNYAFDATPEQALRSNRTFPPAHVNLGVSARQIMIDANAIRDSVVFSLLVSYDWQAEVHFAEIGISASIARAFASWRWPKWSPPMRLRDRADIRAFIVMYGLDRFKLIEQKVRATEKNFGNRMQSVARGHATPCHSTPAECSPKHFAAPPDSSEKLPTPDYLFDFVYVSHGTFWITWSAEHRIPQFWGYNAVAADALGRGPNASPSLHLRRFPTETDVFHVTASIGSIAYGDSKRLRLQFEPEESLALKYGVSFAI